MVRHLRLARSQRSKLAPEVGLATLPEDHPSWDWNRNALHQVLMANAVRLKCWSYGPSFVETSWRSRLA
jgi:hypothetical protein